MKSCFYSAFSCIFAMLFFFGCAGGNKMKKADVAITGGTDLMVADFNKGDKPGNLGQDFGAWNKDEADTTQGCKMEFSKDERKGADGFSLKLSYDVDSANAAFNGFWMKLAGLDARPYKSLAFSIKGDKKEKYTTTFKIELKNTKNETGKTYVTSVSDNWQEIMLPLDKLFGLTDLSGMNEFVIVFEDAKVTEKTGAIYIDDICFVK